jgi:tetratricopeptide (TPR) repeat protein
LTQYEAVRLFIERAQAVKTDFAVTNENAPAVAEICYRLDGLPLAIELAAVRVKLFPPRVLLTRLDDRLKFLTGGARDLPTRQQTIRNTIDWSYNLLDAGEQMLFARLGVFVGGCTIEAAEAVCTANGDLPMEIVDGIAALVDKSLLRQTEDPDGEPRFTMLETIREYALERLEASGEAEALRRQHAEHYLVLAETSEPELHHAEQLTWLQRLEQEYDNLRAALHWGVGQDEMSVRFGAALGLFWDIRGHYSEGAHWLEQVVTQSSSKPTLVQARALYRAGLISKHLGDYENGSARIEGSLAISRALGDQRGIARSLEVLGQMARLQGNTGRAEALLTEHLALLEDLADQTDQAATIYSKLTLAVLREDRQAIMQLAEEYVALCREQSDRMELAHGLNSLGDNARWLGDPRRAMIAFEEALALFRELATPRGITMVLKNMGFVAQQLGEYTRATELFTEALIVDRKTEDKVWIAIDMIGFAGNAGAQQPERAARLLGFAQALLDALKVVLEASDRPDYDRIVAAARAQLGEEAFAAAWEAGRSLTLEQAIEEALSH